MHDVVDAATRGPTLQLPVVPTALPPPPPHTLHPPTVQEAAALALGVLCLAPPLWSKQLLPWVHAPGRALPLLRCVGLAPLRHGPAASHRRAACTVGGRHDWPGSRRRVGEGVGQQGGPPASSIVEYSRQSGSLEEAGWRQCGASSSSSGGSSGSSSGGSSGDSSGGSSSSTTTTTWCTHPAARRRVPGCAHRWCWWGSSTWRCLRRRNLAG